MSSPLTEFMIIAYSAFSHSIIRHGILSPISWWLITVHLHILWSEVFSSQVVSKGEDNNTCPHLVVHLVYGARLLWLWILNWSLSFHSIDQQYRDQQIIPRQLKNGKCCHQDHQFAVYCVVIGACLVPWILWDSRSSLWFLLLHCAGYLG